MSLLSFSAFLLEYVSIFVIEGFFLHVDIWNYTPYQRSIHCIITVSYTHLDVYKRQEEDSTAVWGSSSRNICKLKSRQ